ncbi:hypothetical protein D9M70_540950 [compost metagenome]
MVRAGVDDWLVTSDDVGDQVTGAGTNAEAVPAEAGGEDEPRYGGDFADARHTVRRAVDITRPCGGDTGVLKVGQEVERARMGEANSVFIDCRIKDAHALHWRRRIEAPASQALVTGTEAFDAAGCKAAPAPGEHRQKLRRETQLLRRRIDTAAATDGERVAAVPAARHRNGGRMQRVRKADGAWRDGQD